MNEKEVKQNNKTPTKLIEGVDFYTENGLMVLTAKFLSDRGYCCDNGCRHCPYPINKSEPNDVDAKARTK